MAKQKSWIKGVSGVAYSFVLFKAGQKVSAPVEFKKISGEWYHRRR